MPRAASGGGWTPQPALPYVAPLTCFSFPTCRFLLLACDWPTCSQRAFNRQGGAGGAAAKSDGEGPSDYKPTTTGGKQSSSDFRDGVFVEGGRRRRRGGAWDSSSRRRCLVLPCRW